MALSEAERVELITYLDDKVAESPRLEAWVKGAELRVSRCYFGKAYIYALSLMVMHKAFMQGMAADGVAGPVTNKREGDLSVSFGSGGADSGSGDLGNSVYGQEYINLLKQYSPTPGVTGSVCCGGF